MRHILGPNGVQDIPRKLILLVLKYHNEYKEVSMSCILLEGIKLLLAYPAVIKEACAHRCTG